MKDTYYIDLTKGNKKIEGIIKLLYTDITNQLGNADFPFIFMAEALPNKKLITEKLSLFSSERLIQSKAILLITNPTSNNYKDEWELMQSGINDIYHWAGEDDFKNYILFSIQRIALQHVQHKKITIGEIPIEERKYACHQQQQLQYENSLDDIVKQMLLKGDNYNGIKEKVGSAAFEAAIDICGGNKQKAAERLGVDVRTVQLGVKKK